MAHAEIALLKKLGRHAWRLSWWLFGIQVVATAAGAAMLRIVPKSYESTTTIRVERSEMLTPLVRGLAVSPGSDERIGSIREEILSRDYFNKVISRLALEPPNTPPLAHEARVQEMMRNTKIRTSQRDTFQITYRGVDPKEVRDVTNVLAGIFTEDSLTDKSSEAGSAVEFLKAQLEVYRRKLEESEAALRSFEEKNIDQMPSNRAANMARAEQLRATLTEVQGTLRQARNQRDMLQQKVSPSETPATDAATPGAKMVVNPLLAQLREKDAQLRRLLVNYSESYPDVVTLRAEIAELMKELDKNPVVPAGFAMSLRAPSVEEALNLGQLQQLELQIDSLTTREKHLTEEVARYEKKVRGIPELEQQMTSLRRDYDVNNDIYNNFLRRLEEANVSLELEASKKGQVFRILQAAVLPLTPASPNKVALVLLGVAAGLGLNALLVLAFAQLDTSIQSVEEAQKLLNVKVLAGIPWHEPAAAHTRRVLKAAALTILALVYVGGVATFLFEDVLLSLLRKVV